MNIEKVEISKIKIGTNRRPLGDISGLIDSMQENGLINPITLTTEYKLIAGLHRLKAGEALGWSHIKSNVVPVENALEAELIEIDENLIRNELTEFQRSRQEGRRKVVYEELYPETKREATLKQYRSADSAKREKPSFVADTAAKTGRSERVIREDIQIHKGIPEELDGEIIGTPLEDSKTDLLTLCRMQPDEQRVVVRKVKSGEAKNVRSAVREINNKKRIENTPEPPAGKYQVIYADPPWRYEHPSADNRKIENHYPTMSLEEICALPVQDIADDNCMLFMWTTSPKLEESFEVMRAWGFEYRTCAVWDKEIIGMGYYFRQQHELLLVGKRGNPPAPATDSRVSSVIKSRRERHSKKPEKVYEIIENMYPGYSRIELFCREKREGWEAYGNEI